MKKILLLTSLFFVFTLSACTSRPFSPPAGTELIETDTLEYIYRDGEDAVTLFTYTLDQTFTFFEGPISGSYDFKTINNYEEISTEFIKFLNSFDYVQYDSFLNETITDNDIELSLGATERNYNSIDVKVDDRVYDVDAYISTENGVRIIFSYSEFYSNQKRIIVPFHISITAHDVHEAVKKEYLGENNDYTVESAVKISYITHVVPFPPKTGVLEEYIYGEPLEDIDYFTKVFLDEENTPSSLLYPCDNEVTDTCFEREFSTVKAYVYDMELLDVEQFYLDNYNGFYDNYRLVITNRGITFGLVLSESTLSGSASLDGEPVDVIRIDVELID